MRSNKALLLASLIVGTPAQPNTVPAQQPSWGQGQPRVFPVFYEWSFRTGELADFEVLAEQNGLRILESFGVHEGEIVTRWPNLMASKAVFKFERR